MRRPFKASGSEEIDGEREVKIYSNTMIQYKIINMYVMKIVFDILKGLSFDEGRYRLLTYLLVNKD